jgi:DNA-binding GntR family transcriptional regulator
MNDVRHLRGEESLGLESVTRARAVSAATEVYSALRELIISLALVPGTVLSRAELSERFGVSQTPIRDALMRLEAERLVDVFPQSATVVTTIDIEMAKQAHFLRRALEAEIVGLLADARNDGLIDDLNALIQRQEADIASGDLEDFSKADSDMHACMFEAADVPDLLALVRSRSGHIDRLRRLHLMTPGQAQRILDDHRRIIAAIDAGDPDRARTALRHHLSGTLAEALNIKAQFPAYFSE